jgi:hypothetical protein
MPQSQPAIIGGAAIVGKGIQTTKDITAATALKTSAGRVAKVSVLVVGTSTGSVNDCATTGAVALANQVAVIPEAVGVYDIDMPTSAGIVITPGAGQTLAVSWG